MEPAGSRDWACRYELRCRRNCGRALSMGESGLGRTVEARYTTARSTTRASASRPVLLPAATRGPARAWVACASNGGRCSLLLLKTSLARNRGIDGSLRSCGAVQPSRSTDGHVDDPAHHDAGDDLRAGTDRPSAAAETAAMGGRAVHGLRNVPDGPSGATRMRGVPSGSLASGLGRLPRRHVYKDAQPRTRDAPQPRPQSKQTQTTCLPLRTQTARTRTAPRTAPGTASMARPSSTPRTRRRRAAGSPRAGRCRTFARPRAGRCPTSWATGRTGRW